MFTLPARMLLGLALLALAACSQPNVESAPDPVAAVPVPAIYQAVQDGDILIPAVDASHLTNGRQRAEVDYAGDEKPGSIVVDTFARRLYYILEGNRAVRYNIAVGREGLSFRGAGVIGRKEEWPSWQPTANMIKTRPDLYAKYAAGMDGGLDNPLGARAMYLYRDGHDTMFRIHGTIDNATIGHATSAGCIRLFNQDAIDLYERVKMGTRVKVRSLEESLAMEGAYMDDAWGRAVPETPENIAKKERDLIAIAEQAEREAEAAALAEKKRLATCKRKGIAPEDCPFPDAEEAKG